MVGLSLLASFSLRVNDIIIRLETPSKRSTTAFIYPRHSFWPIASLLSFLYTPNFKIIAIGLTPHPLSRAEYIRNSDKNLPLPVKVSWFGFISISTFLGYSMLDPFYSYIYILNIYKHIIYKLIIYKLMIYKLIIYKLMIYKLIIYELMIHKLMI